MTRDRRLLIIAGATLIALLIAIAAFSLGVYAGVHGWTAGPPAVAGPGMAPPRPPDQGAAPPEGLGQQPPLQGEPVQPGSRPQLVGQVRSVSGDSIILDTPQGPRPFRLAKEVQVFRVNQGREESVSLEEVIPGEHLAVFGRIEGNGARPLTAVRLVLLPPPQDRP